MVTTVTLVGEDVGSNVAVLGQLPDGLLLWICSVHFPAGNDVASTPDTFVTPSVIDVSVVRQPVVDAGTASTVAFESATPAAFFTVTWTGAKDAVVAALPPGLITTAGDRVPPAVAGSDCEQVPAQTE